MRFSIILPVRNGGEYIKECVTSILAQTYADFNLLVLDNDSTDGTLQWLHTISDKRLQIYPSSFSLSIEENWKRIKDVPRNEFMTMIGHDDILLPGYLQEMSMLIKKHPNAGLYQSHFDYIDEKGKFVRDCQPMAEEQGADEFLSCQFQRKIDSTGTGYMIRSLVFDKLGGMPSHYPNLIFADFQLWVSAMLTAYKATSPKNVFPTGFTRVCPAPPMEQVTRKPSLPILNFLPVYGKNIQPSPVPLTGMERNSCCITVNRFRTAY